MAKCWFLLFLSVLPSQEAVLPSQEALLPSQEAVLISQEALLPSQEAMLPSQEAVGIWWCAAWVSGGSCSVASLWSWGSDNISEMKEQEMWSMVPNMSNLCVQVMSDGQFLLFSWELRNKPWGCCIIPKSGQWCHYWHCKPTHHSKTATYLADVLELGIRLRLALQQSSCIQLTATKPDVRCHVWQLQQQNDITACQQQQLPTRSMRLRPPHMASIVAILPKSATHIFCSLCTNRNKCL